MAVGGSGDGARVSFAAAATAEEDVEKGLPHREAIVLLDRRARFRSCRIAMAAGCDSTR